MTSRDSLSSVATVTQRLAVLLAAGVTPASAWQYLDLEVDSTRVAESILERYSSGDALEMSAWRGLAAAWSIAVQAGAPLAATLRDYAASLRALAHAEREARVALAAPVATARLVMALPAVGLVFGMLLGFDTLSTLLTTPPGWVCLSLGACLMFAAARWNASLVRAARPTDATPGLACDLLAIAVSGGASLDRARALLDDTSTTFSLDVRVDRIDGVLDLSRRAGVPAAELLRSEADEARRDAAAEAQRRASSLAVRLMLPLGVCVLPAFMIVGVAPLLITVVTSTVGTF